MPPYCVLVKGRCRGKKCDFWARIKIRKSTVKKLVDGLVESTAECQSDDGKSIGNVFDEYWSLLGIRDRELLCEEEPDLCEKMQRAEHLAESRVSVARH